MESALNINQRLDIAKKYQEFPYFHPLTCGTDSRHTELVPVADGDDIKWECPDCDYRQGYDPLGQQYGDLEAYMESYIRLLHDKLKPVLYEDIPNKKLRGD